MIERRRGRLSKTWARSSRHGQGSPKARKTRRKGKISKLVGRKEESRKREVTLGGGGEGDYLGDQPISLRFWRLGAEAR